MRASYTNASRRTTETCRSQWKLAKEPRLLPEENTVLNQYLDLRSLFEPGTQKQPGKARYIAACLRTLSLASLSPTCRPTGPKPTTSLWRGYSGQQGAERKPNRRCNKSQAENEIPSNWEANTALARRVDARAQGVRAGRHSL